MNDRIEKRIELKAPVSRIWRALTDYREFGEWFRVKLDGPFVPGQVLRIAGVGQQVQVDQAPIRAVFPEKMDKIGADEAGPASHEPDAHSWFPQMSQNSWKAACQVGIRSRPLSSS